MLGKWPNPNKLSEMPAWARGLWTRRVLVHPNRWPSARAQEGQLNSAGGLTHVSQPADFRFVCCSSVPKACGGMLAAHQQARSNSGERVLSPLRAGTMSDVGSQTLQPARRNGGIDCGG
jgi:hypothetical protein